MKSDEKARHDIFVIVHVKTDWPGIMLYDFGVREYRHWLADKNRLLRRLRREGHFPGTVVVKLADLSAWAEANDRRVNDLTLSLYAFELLRRNGDCEIIANQEYDPGRERHAKRKQSSG